MTIRRLWLGFLLVAFAKSAARAETGFFAGLVPSSALTQLRSLQESFTPAPAGAALKPVNEIRAENNRPQPQQPQRPAPQPPRQEPTRQAPPRQAPPPRQEPPRQSPPPRQEPPRQEPPRQQPQRPPQQPQQPQRPPQNPQRPPQNPQRPPQNPQQPQNPQRPPQNPQRPPQNPQRPPQNPQRPPQNPQRPPQNPQKPPQNPQPPTQRPPVVVKPGEPGRPQPGRPQPGQPDRGGRVMPVPPKPIPPGRVIDPNRNGDNRAVQPPTERRGQPITQQPLRDGNGRYIPPTQNNVTIINNTTIVNNITNVQNNWRGGPDYGWYDWGGRRVCHHYDDWGYHWWGFYIGDVYFWTRYYDDRYWWYDPYWHRWVYLHDGRWWWQGPDRVVYVIIDDGYYRYGDDAGTVVIAPDPTPPVVIPPSSPATPAPQPSVPQTSFYSEDATRSVQIVGDNAEAYLYDLTVADSNDPKAQGIWLAAGVSSVRYAYAQKSAADGSRTKVLRQIELSFHDGTKAYVDPNGERKVAISGDSSDAYLYNLADASVDPVFLVANATGVTMFDQETTDDSGETIQRLTMVSVAATDDQGQPTTALFDRDGASFGSGAARFSPTSLQLRSKPAALPSAAPAVSTLQQKAQGSEALKALKSGLLGW